jgi:hypothetical protein
METSDFINLMTEKFNNLVEELIPSEEIGFKEYAKKKLNPLLLLSSRNPLIDAHKIISSELTKDNIDFKGAKRDHLSQLKYLEWTWQLAKLFITEFKHFFKEAMPETQKDEQILKLKDYFDDLTFQFPPFLKSGITEVQEYLITKNLNNQTTSQISQYYFDLTSEQVEKLYHILLENQMLEANKYFLNSFDINNNPNKNISTWNHKQTSAFYLLFLLNKKSYDYNNINLGQIYLKLFKRNVSKSESKNISTNFGKFRSDTSKMEFRPKYISIIDDIYNQLLP